MPSSEHSITGLVLAGGRGQRAGGRDKGLIAWQGRPLVEHVLARIAPQVDTVLLSCNRNVADYDKLIPQPITDLREDFQGPLAGVEAAGARVMTDYLLLAPCDTPELPFDLASRLYQQLATDTAATHGMCVPWDGEREQYLCALIRRSALTSLTAFLDAGGRAVREWYQTENYLRADFSDCAANFRNLNRLN